MTAFLAQLPVPLQTIVLLVLSNVFMSFVPFAVFYMGQPLTLDDLWAALCLMGAVYFVFRS
jgi:uncharacterized protein (DUF486 family)